jgi:Fic family protein
MSSWILSVTLYRIESQKLSKSEIFYLVKDVRLGGTAFKVRIKLGTERPTCEVEGRLTSTPNVELEVKVIKKRLSFDQHTATYLTKDEQSRVDETRYWTRILHLFLSSSEYEQVETVHETDYIAGTTSIEGNTLTVSQVNELIHKGISPKGKPLREQLEVVNAEKAGKYRASYTGRVQIPFILKLHAMMLDQINDQAGHFRRIDVAIVGEDVAVTPWIEIEHELKETIKDYYKHLDEGRHPFEEAVIFHHRFERIHPFIDGNGRVGRELLRHMLARAGYPDIVVKMEDRETYLDALRAGNDGKMREMIEGFAEILVKDRRAKLYEDVLSNNMQTGAKKIERKKTIRTMKGDSSSGKDSSRKKQSDFVYQFSCARGRE